MTCYNCIHFDNCLNNGKTRYYGTNLACDNVEEHCKFFKDKFKFVEVVRCKNCKSYNIYYPRKDIGKEPEPAYYCESFECYTKPTDFCSDGERKCEDG